jgi:hypothetical protein
MKLFVLSTYVLILICLSGCAGNLIPRSDTIGYEGESYGTPRHALFEQLAGPKPKTRKIDGSIADAKAYLINKNMGFNIHGWSKVIPIYSKTAWAIMANHDMNSPFGILTTNTVFLIKNNIVVAIKEPASSFPKTISAPIYSKKVYYNKLSEEVFTNCSTKPKFGGWSGNYIDIVRDYILKRLEDPDTYYPLEWSDVDAHSLGVSWLVLHKFEAGEPIGHPRKIGDKIKYYAEKVFFICDNKVINMLDINYRTNNPETRSHSIKDPKVFAQKLVEETIINAGSRPTKEDLNSIVALAIVASMNDPTSYQSISWSLVIPHRTGKYWIVSHKFRGKNAFGALMLNNMLLFIKNGFVVKTLNLE